MEKQGFPFPTRISDMISSFQGDDSSSRSSHEVCILIAPIALDLEGG